MSTYPLFHPVEFTKHDLNVNEKHNVANDQERHISEDSFTADFCKADDEYLRDKRIKERKKRIQCFSKIYSKKKKRERET